MKTKTLKKLQPTQFKSLIKKIDAIFSPWAKNNSPGCAIGIVRNGKPLYLQGYGMTNLEYSIPNTSKTIFHIASESKKFTAFAILLLEQQGKLKIDDNISQYLPYVPDFGEKITIKNLIQHTSGIRDLWELFLIAGWRLDDIITQQQIINMVKLQKELNFKPGEEYMYCNTGYILLAEIVKEVSGKTLRNFTQEYIFNPLKMFHTHFHDDVEMIVPNRAYSYYFDDSSNKFKKSLLNYDAVGPTSLFTTVEDMIKWNRNMDTGEVGGKELIEQLHEKTVLNNGKEISYAFGISIMNYRGIKLVGHGGRDAGFRMYIGRYPEIDILIVVFCNLATMSAHRLVQKIMDTIIEEKIVSLHEEPRLEGDKSNEKNSKMLFQGKIKDWKEEIDGLFEILPWEIVQLHFEDNSINFAEFEHLTNKSQFVQKESLIFEDRNGDKIEIIIDEQKKFKGLIGYFGGEKISLKKIDAKILTETEKTEYMGNYFSDELQIQYQIKMKKDEKLVVSHHRIKEFELIPLQKDSFCGLFCHFSFIRNEEKVITGFQVTNGGFRNLKFIKM